MDSSDDKDDSNNDDNNDKSDNDNGGAASSGGNTIIGLSDQVLNLGTQGDYNMTSDVDWMPVDEEQAALCQCKPIAQHTKKLISYAASACKHTFVISIDSSSAIITLELFKEAMSLPHSADWLHAAREEYESIIRNETFDLVPPVPGRKAIKARWVFRLKTFADGTPERFKARWVAKGFSQIPYIDYNETFAPVVRLENFRLMLAIANVWNLEIHQMDVESAFLQAPITEEIFVEQPEGFRSKKHPDYVCRLRKSLYSIKQAPFEWNRELDSHLRANNFEPTPIDPCIYVLREPGRLAFITVYVDDFTIISGPELLPNIKRMLATKFRCKDLGEARSVLGYEILRDREQGTLDLRQRGRIDEYLSAFFLTDCNPVRTPMVQGLSLSRPESTSPDDLKLPFRRLVARLLYLGQVA
jgi:hypothetical protein